MQLLTRQGFEKAVAFLNEKGRELDRAQLELDLGTGSEDAVCSALAPYQNADGGFGNALEPDVRIESSSVYLTTVALRVLRDFREGAGASMWAKAMDYLMNQYDGGKATWELVPKEVDTIPRPSWWEYKMGPVYFEKFLLNPRAEIVGYMFDSDSGAHRRMGNGLVPHVLDVIDERLEKMGLYDLHCCVRLAETALLPDAWRSRARGTLVVGMKGWLESDTYRPGEFVERKDSFLAKAFPSEIEEDLDALISRQGDDGAWAPWWDWGKALEAEWQQPLVEWKSERTSAALRTLLSFGRVEM